MKINSYLAAGTIAVAVASALSAWTVTADPPGRPKVPKFQVDGTWPKPYPTEFDAATGRRVPWITGEVAGNCIDSRDHVISVNRGNLATQGPETVQGVVAPPVIEIDGDGNTVRAWGDRNVLPNGIHGCFVDYQDNVWIAGNGDGIVQKYSHNGTLLMQIGTRGVCDSTTGACGNFGTVGTPQPGCHQTSCLLNEPADMYVDPKPDPVTGRRGSVYVADGYGNHRVVVFDADGNFLRQWGAVAGTVNNPATDSPAAFASGDGGHPHCVLLANDNLVYTCDRGDDRIQAWTKTGTFVRVIPVVRGTGVTTFANGHAGLGTAGSAWDLDFSNDAFQAFMLEMDGGNEQVHIMDRVAGSILSSFGQPGHEPGKFTYGHTLALDSEGNLYTAETINGRRLQKFVRVECNNGNGHGNGNGRCDD